MHTLKDAHVFAPAKLAETDFALVDVGVETVVALVSVSRQLLGEFLELFCRWRLVSVRIFGLYWLWAQVLLMKLRLVDQYRVDLYVF